MTQEKIRIKAQIFRWNEYFCYDWMLFVHHGGRLRLRRFLWVSWFFICWRRKDIEEKKGFEKKNKEKESPCSCLLFMHFHVLPRTVGRFLSSSRTSRTMKPINASSTMSQEKMTTWNRNWMLCMLYAVKRMLQCSTLMCDFVACSMLHCSIRLVGP